MKKFLFAILTQCFLFFSQALSAQNQQLVADCFTSYKTKGDSYVSLRNFDLAIQQYQAAKYCKINDQQKKQLDSLIADVGRRRQQEMKKPTIIKRY
jgi:hypothetical protein